VSKKKHIDDVLCDWPFEPGRLSARVVAGEGGRDVIQMRIDLGVMQMETSGRPDGTRPGGSETYYDFLLTQMIHAGDDFVMTEDQCGEADREFVQFYHRRICWLALRDFRRAVRDAEHTLSLMDFCREHSPDERWTMSHEQYRPFVLFHHTQADALATLEESDAEAAVQAINQGLGRFRELYANHDAEEQFEDDEMVTRLVELREALRNNYSVGRTLRERLADAVAAEQYELAARLRDELRQRETHQ